MSESKTEIVTGLAVLALAGGFLWYASRGTVLTPGADHYDLHASFRSVEGITTGTDVRLAGVRVGTVSALTLNPKTYMADAVVTVQKDVAIPDDSTILISSEGLLGGNFVEIQPGGSPMNLEPGGEIEDTQGAVSLITLLMKFVGGGDSTAAGGNAAASGAGATP